MSYNFEITVSDFKSQFDRGQFNYISESEITNSDDVRDKDIEGAILDAVVTINQDLYPSDNDYEIGKKALLYLTAHFLAGIINETENEGQPDFVQNSRSVGSVSESLSIPEWMNDSVFAMFITTTYGIRFLAITKPYLDGAVFYVTGATQP